MKRKWIPAVMAGMMLFLNLSSVQMTALASENTDIEHTSIVETQISDLDLTLSTEETVRTIEETTSLADETTLETEMRSMETSQEVSKPVETEPTLEVTTSLTDKSTQITEPTTETTSQEERNTITGNAVLGFVLTNTRQLISSISVDLKPG